MNAVTRVDALAKVTGAAGYASDIVLPGMLHAKVLRSPHPRARIVAIETAAARALPGVEAVATRDDLVEMERTTGWRMKDWPILAFDTVSYEGDVVAAVAACDDATAFRALERIAVTYTPLPAVGSIDAALAADAPQIFDPSCAPIAPRFGTGASAISAPARNVCYRFELRKGDVAKALRRCDHVFADTFEFSRSQHFHLEPYVSVAGWQGDRLEVWSGTQSPFQLRAELARIFRLPQDRVRIHVPFVGGAFGAKNNCRNEALAALLARMTRRPVRLCYSFDESFHTLSQHAARLTLRTGVMRDGTLVARESEILLDAGAYTDASPLVCDKAGYRVGGAYRWEALLSRCSAVVTNTVPAGPYRGFGGPQASWAAESQLDTIARRLGIDPYEIRVKNLLQLGEPFLPGESGIDSDLQLGLDLVCERLGYHRRAPVYGRGMGLAVGIKDGGGQNKPAQARIKLTPDGHALLHCGSVELGQGIATALSEVVAAVLKIPREWVTYTAIDTDLTPYDQGTNSASGGTVMGRAVEAAAREVRERVLRFAAAELGCDPGELDLERWCVVRGGDDLPVGDLTARAFGRAGLDFEGFGFFKMPYEESAPHHAQTMFWECGWAGAEVEVDESTGTVRVVRLIVSGDPGKTLNPAAAHGQEEANALANYAQAMFERMIYADGRLCNPTALSYRVLTANDLPSGFEMLFQEQGHGPGPFGSKGAGEGSLLVVASAIANAIEDAIGVRVTKLPLSPENVYDAIQASRAQSSHGRRTSGFM